jgi:hypothetical protein
MPFRINAPCKYTPLLKLHPFTFGLTPFDRMLFFMLTPTYMHIMPFSTMFMVIIAIHNWPYYLKIFVSAANPIDNQTETDSSMHLP